MSAANGFHSDIEADGAMDSPGEAAMMEEHLVDVAPTVHER
ncbi:hypothetical protein PC120_g87 [Phytophthora cactorum]|nr:hypothetical protein PC120_g87 [Phytophthora cactorum]